MIDSQRRNLLRAAGAAFAASSLPPAAEAAIATAPGFGDLSVLDFGAKGDGAADNTRAFQSALDAAGRNGAVVRVPPGRFRFEGRIAIPAGATLEGSWRGPHYPDPRQGTTLLVTAGRDREDSGP